MNKSNLLKKFSTLTRVMSNRGDIKVRIFGGSAYTDFSSITLPVGDFNDKDYLELLEGAIDHEVGHIQWTCAEWTKRSHQQGEFFNGVRNAIEDVRMERKVCGEWPGAFINLKRLVTQAMNRQWFCDPISITNPAMIIQAVILYYGRCVFCEQSQLKEFSDSAVKILSSIIGDKSTNELIRLLNTIPDLDSNKDSFNLTVKIIDWLKKLNLDDSDDSQDGDSSDSQDGDSDDSQDGDSGDSQDGDSGDSQDGDSDDSQDGDSSGHDEQEIKDFINASLNASSSDLMDDLHERVNKELEKKSIDHQNDSNASDIDFYVPSILNKGEYQTTGPLDIDFAKKLSTPISRELHKVIYGLDNRSISYAKHGHNIDCNRLAGIKAGNYNVFKTERVTKAPTMAISLLVDRSSSMDKTMMMHANNSALAINLAIDKLKGVSSECLYYSAGDMLSVKPFEATARASISNFRVSSSGGTLTGIAMHTSLRRLALRKEQKKLLIIISDGDTSDFKFVQESLEIAETLDINVVCLGICASKLIGFEEQEFISIKDAMDLPKTLKLAVKSKLIA
ncbi:hypothetical protein [Pseudoalteromonas sp. MQS005]|uniref:hypothetical protein n=1 Tax=Pseudoalteromonas sp. MQS005 TaxID=1854052 RepID=UPI0007E4F611|nr:hypothetical protein [Pseudoalteromonas sp. MQS005]